MTLENLYNMKKEENKTERIDNEKIIQKYRYDCVNQDPKMVRMEIQCNKLRRRKLMKPT